VSAGLGRRLTAAGLDVPADEPPDHLGRELELLAGLVDRARLGRAPGGDGAGEEPDEILGFLDGHVLWWLPALTPAIERHASPFWCQVSGLTLDRVLEHRRALAGEAAPTIPAPWNLMGLPRDPLDDPRADLRELAVFLMLPVRSGLYLSEADVRALGRSGALPGGPVSRPRILETLFHSAVAHQELDAVAEGLRAILSGVREAMEGLVAGRGLPEAFAEPWLRRLGRTDLMLVRMARGEGPTDA
jgi:hypothetical protein